MDHLLNSTKCHTTSSKVLTTTISKAKVGASIQANSTIRAPLLISRRPSQITCNIKTMEAIRLVEEFLTCPAAKEAPPSQL